MSVGGLDHPWCPLVTVVPHESRPVGHGWDTGFSRPGTTDSCLECWHTAPATLQGRPGRRADAHRYTVAVDRGSHREQRQPPARSSEHPRRGPRRSAAQELRATGASRSHRPTRPRARTKSAAASLGTCASYASAVLSAAPRLSPRAHDACYRGSVSGPSSTLPSPAALWPTWSSQPTNTAVSRFMGPGLERTARHIPSAWESIEHLWREPAPSTAPSRHHRSPARGVISGRCSGWAGWRECRRVSATERGTFG